MKPFFTVKRCKLHIINIKGSIKYKKASIGPAPGLWEARYHCTNPNQHLLSGLGRASFYQPKGTTDIEKPSVSVHCICAQQYSSEINQLPVTDITRSRSSLLSFSRFSFSRAGPCRPESRRASLNSGSAKSMNDSKALQHLHGQKACPHDIFLPSWHASIVVPMHV